MHVALTEPRNDVISRRWTEAEK